MLPLQLKVEFANETQRAFVLNTKRESCFDGGIGNGKTTGGLLRLLLLATSFPGSRWVVARQTYKDLVETTRKTFEDKLCPPLWIKRNVKESTGLIDGTEILWMHLDEFDEGSLKSLEINGAFIDQAEEVSPDVYEVLDSRIGRWRMPTWEHPCPAYIWITDNPRGHDWIYYRFHPDCVSDPDRAYFFANTLANRSLLDRLNPGYVDRLLAKPESWKAKWVYGSRDIFEGMIHKDWRNDTHVYDPKSFSPFHFSQIRAVWGFFDYGISAPTCLVLFAAAESGHVFAFREYYERNRKISEHADSIKRMIHEAEQKFGFTLQGIYADPSIFYQTTRDRSSTAPSSADEYRNHGVYLLKAENNEDLGIERLNEMLATSKDRINPITGVEPSPLLFVSRDCPNLIEQIPLQRWKEQRNALTGEKEYVEERDIMVPDHAYDCAKYMANAQLDYRPYRGPVKIPKYQHVYA